MDEVNGSVVILGGGPCGLYAARVLSRAGVRVTVLEKAERPGGLATSHRRGENWYDLGCHMLHEADGEIYADLAELMGDERIPVELDARIRWAGRTFRYPLQFRDMIRGLSLPALFVHTFGLCAAQARQSFCPRHPANAEEALIQLYGAPLYRFFFRDFTHRYWGIPPRDLSAAFITAKMPRLSAVDVIKQALGRLGVKAEGGSAVDSALREETLHYSRTGAEAMPRALARAITDCQGRVVLEAEVTGLILERGCVTGVRYRQAGNEHTIACDECISTIPLPRLVRMTAPAPPEEVQVAARHLRFKPIAVYGLLVRRERCLDGLYIYCRDRIFHRVGEPKNAGLLVRPSDHTVLLVEMTCEVGDERWEGSAAAREQIYADLERENLCRRDEVVEVHVLHGETAYPIFALGFEPYLATVQKWIGSIPNLQSTGRQGAFTYPNMHGAMRQGATCAGVVLARLNRQA